MDAIRESVILVDRLGLSEDSGHQRVSYDFRGETLYFTLPAHWHIRFAVEAILCGLLLPAMQRNCAIQVAGDYPVSGLFLRNIARLQDILVAWYPGLHVVDIRASVMRDEIEPWSGACAAPNIAAFYSGGIDANYTLLKHCDEITDLIYVRGVDMQLDDEDLWSGCVNRFQQIAAQLGKRLITVETNVRFFIRALTDPPLGWYTAQGCGLAGVAHAVGANRVYVGSSNTYAALHPLGSHPLTDPLFSSEAVSIVHDGCEARRYEKLQRVVAEPQLRDNIRVCWQDQGFNCGHCDKCLHFRMSLNLLDIDSGAMERLSDYGELRGAHVSTPGDRVEWEDNLALAREVGDQRAMQAIERLLRPYRVRQLLKNADSVILGGVVDRWRKRRSD